MFLFYTNIKKIKIFINNTLFCLGSSDEIYYHKLILQK